MLRQTLARAISSRSKLTVVGLGHILSQLFSRIDAVKNCPADGDISVVRDGLGKLAAIYPVGLLTAVTIVVLQLALIFATAAEG